ncbi:hypothetical protein BJV78DRAFT_1351441 [Lactifluus subvellereus]|nr:hypothetical protein BJV78DRAFT_1351441 [Lactifluus subvellereus]
MDPSNCGSPPVTYVARAAVPASGRDRGNTTAASSIHSHSCTLLLLPSPMAKQKRSESTSSPGPSRIGVRQIQPGSPAPIEDVPTEGLARTEGDPTATNPRCPSPELLSIIEQEMEFVEDGDPAVGIYLSLRKVYMQNPPVPEGFVTRDIFLRNVSHEKGSDFLDLAKKALKEQSWKDVVIHDVFWTELPTDSKPGFLSGPGEMLVPQELSEQGKSQKLRCGSVPKRRFGCFLAAELSWIADFVNQDALEGLERHVTQQMAKWNNYTPLCPIVQSSGMGKSRLVDEFSKVHFLIPINLRKKHSQGLPPTDVALWSKDAGEVLFRACHFLFSLFVCTKDTITTLDADNKKDRIVKFREFMSEGQRFGEVGKKRKNFYAGVVSQAQKAIDDRLETPSKKKLLGAFETLQGCVCDGSSPKGKPPLADVFIAFDEAHQLIEPWDNGSTLSNYTELQQVLRIFSTASLFTFFVSTNPEISQFAMPRTSDSSNRILQGRFHTPRPFIELGFDQLMWNRKILDEYKTLEQVTSSECIAHLGRPLWGTMYDHGDNEVREHMLFFAIQKLLGSPIVSADTWHKRYAVLSQRLALDINTTAYISPSLSDAGATLEQAASHVMRDRERFDLANALSDFLGGFSIHTGDRGELLVAAFFTWARDAVMLEQLPPRPEICRHFSVEELFSCLFSEEVVESIFNHTPSISPPKAKQRTFGEVASSANMHFNHFIRSQEQELITRRYLIAFIARGAAVLGANCQPALTQFSHISMARRFPIPIIRIVFALRGKQSTVTPMSYSSPSEGACSSRFDERGEPRFTSYDYWCSGIGPDLLQPVGKADWKWEALLDLPDGWSSFYNRSPAPDVLRSQFPASSHDKSHLKRWLSDSWISGHS